MSIREDAPHLAGQQRTYLFNQIVNFRSPRVSGRLGYKVSERSHPEMSSTAALLRDTDIADIAAYLNRLPCTRNAVAFTPARPALAAKCEFCHGTNGTSPFIAIPKISGQKEGYIVRQLQEFRESARHFEAETTRSHRLVLAVAMDLSDADIEIAARYYSQLSCR